MRGKDENITMGLDRLNAVFAWWGVPGPSGISQIDDQMKSLQTFTADLQKAYRDAYSKQMASLFGVNERITQSLQEIFRCKQPQDLIAAKSKVMATILEEAAQQAKTWVEFTRKVQDCCVVVVREASDPIFGRPNENVDTNEPSGTVQLPLA